jgi:hypothetical protein
MAKRRKVSLGGGHAQHEKAYVRAARQAHSFATMAIRAAEEGSCARAVRFLTAAWDERGNATANMKYTKFKQSGRALAVEQRDRRAHGDVPPAYKTTEEAERVVVAKCIR